MSTNELRVLSFIDGNMQEYEAESQELLGRAVTARETIDAILDCQSEIDANIRKGALETVKRGYLELVKEHGRIPQWSTLMEYLEADSCEALVDLASVYWHLHEDTREERERYMALIQQGREEDAQEFMDDCISQASDWIMESEYNYYYMYWSCNWTTGVLRILSELGYSFEVDCEDSDFCDVSELPPNLTITMNDAQQLLFPNMVPDYATTMHDDSGTMEYRGVMRRENVTDAVRLEEAS